MNLKKYQIRTISIQVNPDPYVRSDPEVDINKQEEVHGNGTIPGLFSEADLALREEKLKQKIAWRKRVNVFTKKRHLTKRRK